ncbi:MAG: DnaJ domain-containing protein [Anaerolineae bacterium]
MLPRYYDLLSIGSDASSEEIAAARDALLAKYGPHAALADRDALRLMRAIEEAYATLSDPVRRAAYDAALTTVSLAPPAAATSSQPLALSAAVEAPPSPPPSRETPPATTLPPAASNTVALAPTASTDAPLAPVPRPAASKEASSRRDMPSPVALLFFILDWMARQTLGLRETRARGGDVLPGESVALAAGLPNGVSVGAAGWRFQIHDAFPAPSLTMNGARLDPTGQWLLVRLAVRNEWPGHRALRAEDFALFGPSLSREIALHPDATHAARLSLGLRATPAGRYGLGFAALEEKETVLAFDLPDDLDSAFLRLKPAAAIVDLAPVAPLLALGMPGAGGQVLTAGSSGGASRLATGAARLEIVSVDVMPGPGRYRSAIVTARATPGMTCDIRVQYARGHSNSRSLAPAVAGADGVVRWSWRVSPRTRPGEWPIIVTCGHSHAMATLPIAHAAG